MTTRRIFLKMLASVGLVSPAALVEASPHASSLLPKTIDNPDNLPVVKFENGEVVNAEELFGSCPYRAKPELDFTSVQPGCSRNGYERDMKVWVKRDDFVSLTFSWCPCDPFWGEAELSEVMNHHDDGYKSQHYQLSPTEKSIRLKQNLSVWYVDKPMTMDEAAKLAIS